MSFSTTSSNIFSKHYHFGESGLKSNSKVANTNIAEQFKFKSRSEKISCRSILIKLLVHIIWIKTEN